MNYWTSTMFCRIWCDNFDSPCLFQSLTMSWFEHFSPTDEEMGHDEPNPEEKEERNEREEEENQGKVVDTGAGGEKEKDADSANNKEKGIYSERATKPVIQSKNNCIIILTTPIFLSKTDVDKRDRHTWITKLETRTVNAVIKENISYLNCRCNQLSDMLFLRLCVSVFLSWNKSLQMYNSSEGRLYRVMWAV